MFLSTHCVQAMRSWNMQEMTYKLCFLLQCSLYGCLLELHKQTGNGFQAICKPRTLLGLQVLLWMFRVCLSRKHPIKSFPINQYIKLGFYKITILQKYYGSITGRQGRKLKFWYKIKLCKYKKKKSIKRLVTMQV